MALLRDIWKQVSQIGIKTYTNSGIQFEVTSVNRLAFLTFIITVFGIIGNLAAVGMNNMIILLIFYSLFYLSILGFNYYGKYLVAKIVFLLNFQLFHFILATQFGSQSQAQSIFFVALFFIYLLFSENKPITRYIMVGITLLFPVLIFAKEYEWIHFGLWFELSAPKYLDIAVYFTSVIFAVIIISMTMHALRKIFVQQTRNNIDLINSNAAIKAKVQEQVDLFAQVIHDLKSPIQSLIGLSRLMKDIDDPAEKALMLQKRDETLTNLREKTEEELERFKEQKFELHFEKLSIENEIKEVHNLVRFYHGYRKVNFNIDIDQSAPLYLDKKYLQVILGNLISNAIKYADLKKSPELNITVSVDKDIAKIKFEDNGLGIDQEKLPHIFNKLYRATDYGEGSGIGMSLVKKAVETLNGSISIKSEKGRGTSIELDIMNYTEADNT